MVGWHHRLNGHDFEPVLGVGGGQGSLVCCSTWGHKELDTTTPWKESYDQLRQHIKNQRHYFAHKVKVMVFPVVMYGYESWTIKKAEC